VQVVCAAGDLNGSAGDHWDTQGNNFVRLKRALLPPSSAPCVPCWTTSTTAAG
jgi:hypothetical protein